MAADHEEDRISDLPDCLLLIIISFLGCTKQACRTSLLSKRWQFLYLHVSSIDLVFDSERNQQFHGRKRKRSSFMDLCTNMLNYMRSKFSVDFFNQHEKKVDVWVDFAIKNKIENVKLICRGDHYLLPQTLYSHSSMTSLSLCHCDITPRAAIVKWVCLKSLSLNNMELSHSSMEYMLSGCPVLEVLSLSECMGPLGEERSNLNLSFPCLKTLIFEKWKGSYECEISAPYVLNLSVRSDHIPMNIKFTNVSSVVRAKLYLNSGNQYQLSIFNCKELLESLEFVEELELGTWFVEISWAFKWKGLKIPRFTQLRCLTINVNIESNCNHGIIGILESASYLETLFIKGNAIFFDESYDHWYISMNFIPCDHLKNVKITSFIGDESGEPVLSLVEVLLKKARVLEKMVISAKGLKAPLLSSTDLIEISEKLQSFPRASREARVEFDI